MDHHAIPERTRKRRRVGVAAMAEPLPCLPDDLLDVIFSRLPSFADRACCAFVCRAWRNVAPAIPGNVRGARFCGSSAGGKFIIARQDQEEGQDQYALLNVLSGQETALPDDLRLHGKDDAFEYSALVILAATVSPRLNPEGGGDYVIAAIAAGQHKTVFCRAESPFWFWRSFEDILRHTDYRPKLMLEEFEDVTFYDSQDVEQRGFCFLTSSDGLLIVVPQYDDGGPCGNNIFYVEGSRLQSIAGLVVAGRYLVESRGRLLTVQRFVSPGHGTVYFRTFRLYRQANGNAWTRTSGRPPASGRSRRAAVLRVDRFFFHFFLSELT
ncbi:hypothetical protein BS78_09G243900 [Paspalum vaginatum]|nr:hypothetical protein BS78_09G243900 [Paspalum vaginatum]